MIKSASKANACEVANNDQIVKIVINIVCNPLPYPYLKHLLASWNFRKSKSLLLLQVVDIYIYRFPYIYTISEIFHY